MDIILSKESLATPITTLSQLNTDDWTHRNVYEQSGIMLAFNLIRLLCLDGLIYMSKSMSNNNHIASKSTILLFHFFHSIYFSLNLRMPLLLKLKLMVLYVRTCRYCIDTYYKLEVEACNKKCRYM